MKNKIFIPGDVPSSKNGQVWTGKFLVAKPAVQKYKKNTKVEWLRNKIVFLEMIKDKEPPYNIKFKFIRGSKRRFDYINMLQTVQDLMVDHEWIEDDNANFLTPIIKEYEEAEEKRRNWVNFRNKRISTNLICYIINYSENEK